MPSSSSLSQQGQQRASKIDIGKVSYDDFIRSVLEHRATPPRQLGGQVQGTAGGARGAQQQQLHAPHRPNEMQHTNLHPSPSMGTSSGGNSRIEELRRYYLPTSLPPYSSLHSKPQASITS